MGYNSQISDVNNSSFINSALTVTTSQTEIKVGLTPLDDREMVRIYNNSSQVVFYGATGVTVNNGEPIEPGSGISIPAGPNIAIYAIVATGTAELRIQEMG
jgi:hypothetical protein